MPQKFLVTAGSHEFEIHLKGEHLVVNGTTISVSARKVADSHYSLIIDHESFDVVLNSGSTTSLVRVQDCTVPVTVKDARALLLERYYTKETARAAAPSLRAPMPGLVLRVHVAQGDEVAAGQGLLVLEAMKMENELRAPAAGVVRQIHATAGTSVAKDAVLIEFSP